MVSHILNCETKNKSAIVHYNCTHISCLYQEGSLVNKFKSYSNGKDTSKTSVNLSTINETSSCSDDEIQYLTQEIDETHNEQRDLPFSQSSAATLFPLINEATPKMNQRDDDEVLMIGETEEEEDDDDSFGTDDGSISDNSAVLCCDDDVLVESISEMPDRERMAKAIEDYDLEGDLFDESDLVKWKEKEQKLVDRFKNG